jgi:hypothetical protein
MNSSGVDTSKVKLKYFKPNHRGLVATKDIKKHENILFIPKKLTLTFPNMANSLQIKNKKKL